MQIRSLASDLPTAADAVAQRQQDRLRTAATGFEALFMNEMLKAGRAVSFDDGITESSATKTSRAMLDTTLAEISAGRTGLGLGDAIYRQFAGHLATERG